MALRLAELNPDVDYEYVITPTGDELPDMFAHWAKLERLLGKPMTRLNTMTLEQCIEKEGMIPNFRARFCTRILKIEPFIDHMLTLDEGSVMYVGLRADEGGRLGLVPPGAEFEVSYPMREWDWSIEDVKRYLDCHGIEVPRRTDCGACFYQRLHEWKFLLDNFPDRYEQYVQIEKRMGYTFRSDGRDTWPASLDELRKEFQSGRKLRKSPTRKKDDTQICRFCSM